jgi:pimeloyl-ACP methyl ester carboxylesterase
VTDLVRSDPTAADPIPAWPGELTSTGAGEVFVRSAPALPDAEPALFVHGLAGASTNWTDLVDQLRKPPPEGQLGPVLAGAALDLPGFGFSPVSGAGDYSLNGHVAAVIGLLDQRGREPVHLVGNSLGGAVATRVAARRPDLVRTLTLISPALPDLRPRMIPLRVMALSSPTLGPFLARQFQRAPAPVRRDLALRDVYYDPRSMDGKRRDEEISELLRRDGLPYANDVLVRSARGLVTEYLRYGARSLWRDAAQVDRPTLIIHGSHDRLVNPALAARAARVFGQCRVVVLPRTGHVAMMEHPDWVAQEMRLLLAAPPPGP